MSALLLLLAVVAAPRQASPPVFGIETNLVRVEVSVTSGGRPVVGLGVDDFELRDDGVLQQLQPVLAEQMPVDVVFVLDTSGSVAGTKLAVLRGAAGAFLDGLRADERSALITFGREVRLARPWTADRTQMYAALGGIAGWGSTALCDAVYAGLRLGEPASHRTAVVVFSDGLDTLSWLSAQDVVEAARRSDAIVYGVVARGRGERQYALLRQVTEVTGGRVFPAEEKDLRARFLEVLQDIRNRYLLSYSPSGVSASGWHALAVRLKRGRGEVLARPGYWRAPDAARPPLPSAPLPPEWPAP